MATTIKDIAKAVGVSPSTVSRVINGSAPISEEIKQKINQAMKELNYHPNMGARNLATGSTRTIALVIDAENENAFANTFFNRSVFAIEQVVQKEAYNLLITNDVGNKSSAIKELVYGKKVDGIILSPSSMKKSLNAFLKKEDIPFVSLGESADAEGISWVDVDNCLGSRMAVEHLLKQGYRRLAYVGENSDTVFAVKRIKGFRESLKEENVGAVIAFENGDAALLEELEGAIKKDKIDAFLCANNVTAYHTMNAIKQLGFKIPEEIGIVTFDNQPFAEYMDPPLTAIDVDTYRLGEAAAGMLISRINDQTDRKEELILPKLIIRESTKGKEGR